MSNEQKYTNEQLYHQAIIDKTVIKDQLLAIGWEIRRLEILLDHERATENERAMKNSNLKEKN